MDATTALTAVVTVAASLAGAWTAARKVAGGAALSRALEAALREEREVRQVVAIVALDSVLDVAAGLRTMLVRRGFRSVRCQAAESYHPIAGETVVFVALGDGADAALANLCRAGLGGGLIYSTGRVNVPPGEWTLANSMVTLREPIAFNRAGEAA